MQCGILAHLVIGVGNRKDQVTHLPNFLPICTWVLKQEDSTLSGKVVDLGDGQGLTRFGIGQASNPSVRSDFWTMSAAEALPVAENNYRTSYWNRFQGDQIVDDGVASCLLSFSINDGAAREVRMLQDCLNIPIDGIFGPQTLEYTNAFNPGQLAAALRAAQADFYRALAAKNPADERFLAGWLARAARVYPSLS